jgi:tRNA (guanine-N7-)-methyltransferase
MRVRTLLNPFSCRQRFTKQEWLSVFPHFQQLLDVEIGCGNGGFLVRYAMEHPQRALVGFEIRKRWVEFAQEKIAENKLPNAHLICGNGHFGLEDMFEDNSINRLFIFHPDPWPKKQHYKRRIINQTFLELTYQKLKPEGCLYLATDVQDLWDYMMAFIDASQRFIKHEDEIFWSQIYQTRWQEMSLYHQRPLYYATFRVIK